MATLGNIRKRSGLLLAVIGIAMLAFILTDFMSSLNSGGSNGPLGEVFGEEVSIQLYEKKIEQGINNWKSQNPGGILNQTTTNQIRNQIWDQYIKELIMDVEYTKLGINVSDDEFFELLQGMNVHPQIANISAFQNPTTGVFDRAKVLAYLKQIDEDPTGDAKRRWVVFQEYLVGLITNSKYNSLVQKGLYVTNDNAKDSYNESIQNVTFDYVSIPYSSVSDSLVTLTEKEISKYYNNNKEDYQQQASRDIDYVVFNVTPSIDDDVLIRKSLQDLVIDFKNQQDCISMARRNSDNRESRFAFSNEDNLGDPEFTKLFNAEIGTVIGPYLFSEGVYRIAKLMSSEKRPDSVQARHILITPTEQVGVDSVQNIIADLKKQINNGKDFSDLAQQYSQDQQSAIKGGDLGWFSEGVMVDEFNEVCFTSKKKELNVVNSQYGTHLIQVTNISRKSKKVQIVYIDRNVEASTETFNGYYSSAAQFAGKILNMGMSFDSLVSLDNLVKRTDDNIQQDRQNINGLSNSREIVRWANKVSLGDVSEVFQLENSYVVAYLKNINQEGAIPLEDIREEITALVMKQNKFKLVSNVIGNSTLDDIAADYGTLVVKDKQVNFSSNNIQGIGSEPDLVGSLFSIDEGVVSSPIQGNNSIFIVSVNSKDETKEEEVGFLQQKDRITLEMQRYSNNAAYNVLKKAAKVQDNRSKFY